MSKSGRKMNYRCSLHAFMLMFACLAHAVTDSGDNSSNFYTPTPDPGNVSTEETTFVGPTSTDAWTTTATWTEMKTPVFPSKPSTEVPDPKVCLCDLTPGFCNIGCCCDTIDCAVANLNTVFTGCQQTLAPRVCIQKWLIYRANVDPSLITETDSLFCVQKNIVAPQCERTITKYPGLGNSFHFSPPEDTHIRNANRYYKFNDVIQTYIPSASVVSVFTQPAQGTWSTLCLNHNPITFLRSTSSSCSRMVTRASCGTDPNLDALSYYSDLQLYLTPVLENKGKLWKRAPVSIYAETVYPAPIIQGDFCANVVKNVRFLIRCKNTGEIANASVSFELGHVSLDQLFIQTHSVDFQLITANRSAYEPKPAIGLKAGSPVMGHFNLEIHPVTTLGLSPDGTCSFDPASRTPIPFMHNTFTGCSFTSTTRNCSKLLTEIYSVLQGFAVPDGIAMDLGSEVEWTRVILQDCPVSPQESCDLGCLLPHSLSIQVLWARQGLYDFPQKYILGAKYLYSCRTVKCPGSSPLILTAKVTFTETTVYPETPRGFPQPDWKFPFDFLERGTAELDGHFMIGLTTSDYESGWILVLVIVPLMVLVTFLNLTSQ